MIKNNEESSSIFENYDKDIKEKEIKIKELEEKNKNIFEQNQLNENKINELNQIIESSKNSFDERNRN